jgi:hypothetical protein
LIAANLIAAGVLTFAFAMLEVSDSLILAQTPDYYPITKQIFRLATSTGSPEAANQAAAMGVYGMILLGGTMSLASALYRPQRGQVLLDGADLAARDPREVRRQIATVVQDVFLFAGTAAENIRLWEPGFDAARVEAAARQARAHEFIVRLPGGYEQLRSRSGAQYIMQIHEEISAGDVKAVADSVLKSLGHHRELSQASCKYLTALAEADGALRNVVHRLHAVHDLAEASGAAPTYRVAELDIVAPLVGHACQIPDAENPFENAREAAGGQRAAG